MIAVLLQVALSSFVGLVLSLFVGHLTPAIAWTSLIVGTTGAFLITKNKWCVIETKHSWTPLSLLVFFFASLVVTKHFAYLFYLKNGVYRTLDTMNLGDLPLHITYIRFISSGSNFWPDNPIFSGTRLEYPIGIDFYNALWDILGVPLTQHLPVIGMVLGLVALFALQKVLGWLGVFAYVFGFAVSSHWKNFFLSMLVPQRGFLFALPVGLLLLLLAQEHFIEKKVRPRNHYVVMGFLWGMLPFFHLHTFITVSLIFVLALVASRHVQGLLKMLPWLLLAIPLAWLVSGGGNKGSIMHFSGAGWMTEGRNIFRVWMDHLHLWWILLYGTLWWLFKNKKHTEKYFFVLNMLWWILFNFVILAVWDWDNLKLLQWFFFAMLLPVSFWVLTWPSRIQEALFVILLLLSAGPKDVWQTVATTNGAVELFKLEELNKAQEALKGLEREAVLTLPTYNHPVSYWGFPMVMGYDGHIHSYGLQVNRKEDIRRIYKGEPGWGEAFNRLNPRYIVWGQKEQQEYLELNPEIVKNFRKISSVQGFEIYAKH